ncbi:MAG: hypothetical protein ACOC1L_00540 [Bacillota bacterium]
MKKIFITTLLCFALVAFTKIESRASSYLQFEELTFENFGGRLLRTYDDEDFQRYYKKIDKRKFWGWRSETMLDYEPVTFKKETMYIISNEGSTPIEKSIQFEHETTTTREISATGNIGITGSGSIKAFKLGLDTEIEIESSVEIEEGQTETIDIDIEVDPDTVLYVAVYGEGYISNGVAKHYRFWINTRKGGWEVFTLTTEYFSIIKERLNETQ